MKTKPGDLFYCGVNKEKIKSAKPKLNEENVRILFSWINERYKIHLKKDVEKLPPPWTTDEILQKYRFTNVRREHDKETLWLIKNICSSENLTYSDKLLNCILFRLFNKSETLSIIQPLDFLKIGPSSLREKINMYRKNYPLYVFFSNAFFTSGPKSAANKLFPAEKDMVIKIVLLVDFYREQGIIEKITKAKDQSQVYLALKEYPGLGDFLAYQIFVDFTYIPEFPFSENEFTIAGPGCKKGLSLLFSDFNGLSFEEALFWLRDNQKEIFSSFNYNPQNLFKDLPEEERHLNVMSLENCMCELSKYIRALKGEGRPRVRYKINLSSQF